MRWSQLAGRRSGKHSTHIRSAAIACVIDRLESRRLFSGEAITTPIAPVLATVATPSANAITLNQHFNDPNLPGTLATFNTSLGSITVALTDAATPLTVANFLSYVNSGAYTDTIFHRTAVLSATGGGGSPTTPADIIQGGGYVVSGLSLPHIPTRAPVADEFTSEIYNDSSGTLAMAKTSNADSASSEWYFNVHNNVSALDKPTTDSSGRTTSYTVFGKVMTGMSVVDKIASLPTFNVSSSLNTVPVVGLTEHQAQKLRPITANNLVYTDSISTTPGTSYTVTSDNTALVTPKVTNGVLSFTYASGLFGTTNITVLAKNMDGSSASTTFAVTVPNSATPSAGPTAAAVTAPNVVSGNKTTFSVLTKATDSVAALNQSSVAILTQPAHGTASVNSSTGLISYTPTAGYTGADTLTYTVADMAGAVSIPATVTLNVVSPPVVVTIGTSAAHSLTFTQPGGVVGHLTIKNGTAVVTFASSAVTTSTTGGVVTTTGAGDTIASIVVTDIGGPAALNLTATGGVNIGSVTDAKPMSILNAPDATLTGGSSFESIGRLIVAGATDSTLSLGSGDSTALIIPNVTDTTVTDTGSISSITSTQWLNDNSGFYSLSASRIGQLNVTGTFANVLNLSSTSNALGSSTVGVATAAWNVTGSIGSAGFSTPASTWSLASTGAVGRLSIAGNLTNSISAASINSLVVSGTTIGATIKTTSTTSGIGRLKMDGPVTSTSVIDGGHLGSLTAPSLTSTNVSAGAIGAIVDGGAATGSQFTTTGTATNQMQIGRLQIGGAFASSSVSTSGGVGEMSAASLSSSQITAGSLASLFIAGVTNAGTISTNATFISGKLQIGRLKFGGAVEGSLINAVGNIGDVTAASLTGVQVYAGATDAITQKPSLPTSTASFTFHARIGSVVLGNAATAFSNSLISAEVIGPVRLGNVNTSNSGTTEGIAAHTFSSFSGTLIPGGVLNVGPKQLRSSATLGTYIKAKKITLGDFVLSVI